MIKYLLKPIFLFLININLIGQTPSSCSNKAGVFANLNAFLTNSFTDSICLDTKGDEIKLGNNNIIKIHWANGEKKKYLLGELIGYSDGKYKYRYYFNDKAEYGYMGYFKIEETKGLIIYSQWYLHGGTVYFYSKDFESPIKELNRKNLEHDFPNEQFIKEVKALKDLSKKDENSMQISTLYNKYFPSK